LGGGYYGSARIFMPHLKLIGLRLQVSQKLISGLQRVAVTDVFDALNDDRSEIMRNIE
jgi:hypothetical protein